MYIHLPWPYPDELLYSVIARFCFYYHRKPRTIIKLLSGKATVMRPDLPASLNEISKKTYFMWRLSGEDILQKMTLFPLYQPFLPLHRVRAAEYYLSRSAHHKGGIGLKCYRVVPPQFLRLCKSCVAEDFNSYGETYWHRVHQVPGVVVCPQHGEPLAISDVPITSPKNRYLSPIMHSVDSPQEQVRGQDLPLAKKIAERCNQILLGDLQSWEAEDLRLLYIERALERGFERVRGVFSSKKLEQKLLEFYGESLLNAVGIPRNDNGWMKSPFCKPSRSQSIHPLEHVLIQVFLDNMPVLGKAQPFGIRPWRCPNPYENHGDEFPIKKVAIRTNQHQEVYARTKCSCGFKFTFTEVTSNDPHLPIIKEISAYGPTWQAEAQRLKSKGMSNAEVAKSMSLPITSARKLLKTSLVKTTMYQGEIIDARDSWIKILQDHNGSTTSARKENYGLYQFLRKYDHDWIISQSLKPKTKIDWGQRDVEWGKKLEEVGINAAASGSSHRIAPSKLIKEAGLNYRIFTLLERLPLCLKMIEKYSEPAWQSRLKS